jgi:general secretion pathway protein D
MRRVLSTILFLSTFHVFLQAQQINETEYKNLPITDILLNLGEQAGRSIVPDETVTGNGSFYFNKTEFETALQLFLTTYKMYFWKEGSVYYVSKIRTSWNKDAGTASVDADEVDLRLIVRALSKAIGKTILFDTLPRENLTIHVQDMKPEAALKMLMTRFPDYDVQTTADFYYIKRKEVAATGTTAAGAASAALFKVTGDLYSIDVDKARLKDLLMDLFKKAGFEYSFFLRSDTIIENLHFRDKRFEDMLRLVLEQANADYSVEENGIYYIYDIQRADVLKKLKTIHTIALSYISVQDLPNLFPQDMASQNLFRMDRNTNSVILSGSEEEIGPIENFIRSIDRPLSNKSYYRFNLSYLKVADLANMLPTQFSGVKPTALPQTNSFVMLLTPEGKKLMDEYLLLVDNKQGAAPIQLRYIQADYLMKNLPPSVAKEDIVQTGDSTLVFFIGSDEKLRQFRRELEMLDRPAPQIRYELLVIEYQGTENLDWGISAGATAADIATADTKKGFIGAIGNLLKLNFDIVATFGYLFAVNLNMTLGNQKANVLADTTINGLSGQDLKFQNTTTHRYVQPEVDPDTGQFKATGVVREVTYGIILGMNGWVSGDGMITMKVNATVSKQAPGGGADQQTASAAPSTSEKVVGTNVRTPSGKPVVISGLIQQETESTVDKIPILGDIPLLGYLFQTRKDVLTNTEMVIYIVPHIEYPESRVADERVRMENLYERFVKAR